WGFYWTPELGFKVMPKPQGVFSVNPMGINDAGFVVGNAVMSGQGGYGFLFDPQTEQYAFLQPLHEGVIATSVSAANAINNAGVVVGSRVITEPGVSPVISNAVIWKPFEKGSPVQDLGVMNGPNSSAEGGNTKPDAAGWAGNGMGTVSSRAIVWLNGKAQDIGVLPGMVQSQARRINTNRIVLGSSGESAFGPFHSFVWKDGEMHPFLPPQGYEVAGPASINDVGQLAGSMRPTGTTMLHPFIWQHGQFYNVLSLIVDMPANLVIDHVSRVGHDGRMLCRGSLSGKVVSVLLTPINQPLTDLNHDCATNTHDLLILLEQWGPAPTNATGGVPIADFNGDGRVDVLDLLILLGNWG
ncbi:MAG TPA: DUF3466 family protein, partial [Phycisphaerales bacterium]|nr:DUF3466 family protein [Phycisphaerales bacterium]